jgi:ParB family chromosome partitioning protein
MPQSISEVPLDRVIPSNLALRDLDEAAVEELAESIKANGLLQPIMVKPTGNGYELVFGLHRLEACRRLGWRKIPAFVKNISGEEAFLTGLIENLQRNIRINPVAEARGYKRLMAKGWTSHEIAKRIGKSDSYIYDRLRVLDKLHPTIQRQLITHVCKSPITPSHAERLTLIEDPELQLKLAELVREKHLSVRQLERLTRRILSEMPNGCICKQCPNYPCKHIPEQNNLLDAILGESFHQKQQTPATPSLKCQSR